MRKRVGFSVVNNQKTGKSHRLYFNILNHLYEIANEYFTEYRILLNRSNILGYKYRNVIKKKRMTTSISSESVRTKKSKKEGGD